MNNYPFIKIKFIVACFKSVLILRQPIILNTIKKIYIEIYSLKFIFIYMI